MKILLIILIIILPLIMFFLHFRSRVYIQIINMIAVFSMIIFATITVTSVYQILKDDTVFTAAIHAIFINKMFLLVGSYLLLFIIYKLIIQTVQEK